ncbi:MAG: histidine--tRNA ligase, partial [Oceanococcaceae bacterium]
MSQRIRALRGFPDIGPEATPAWLKLEAAAAQLMRLYSYSQVRMPLLEATELFARSVGEVTDIVEKEMFSFVDRDKNAMSLRPEGTASAVRLGIDLGLLHNAQRRLWYTGPMFRHERPQAGRYRQFHQIGVENFGTAGPQADIEVIALSADLLEAAGVRSAVQLELNTLGSAASRAVFRQALQEWLRAHAESLDEDSRSRIERNPLRVLDSKVEHTQALLADAPQLVDYLDEESKAHHAAVCAGLEALGIRW